MVNLSESVRGVGLVTVLLVSCYSVQGQDAKQAAIASLPVIADEPRTVDPATLVPAALSRKMTVDLRDSSLSELAAWIEENAEIPVLFDRAALENSGIPLGEPVSDWLTDDPLYLLLNRLKSSGLSWYVADNVLRITTTEVTESRTITMPYSVGDLLDQKYMASNLEEVIMVSLGGLWMVEDGEGGSLEFLGDVLFVRQTEEFHRRLNGLLTALRGHGRRTFVLDPPEHEVLRSRLLENLSVDFVDVPLVEAVARIAQRAGIDIRVDSTALRQVRIRDREPVTLTLADRELQTVLQVMLSDLKLVRTQRDGVLWITTRQTAESQLITAVYDVRDLCRDEAESFALSDAVFSQTAGPWREMEGEGGTLAFARPGTLIVRHTDRIHGEVLRLLESYRSALLKSKPREQRDPEAEVLTRYYRIQTTVAADLKDKLPAMISPESWKSEENPNGVGSVIQIAGGQSASPAVLSGKSGVEPAHFVTDNTVLVVTQTRATHKLIDELLRRIQQGDGPLETGGGLGGGGFGAGFFSLPTLETSGGTDD